MSVHPPDDILESFLEEYRQRRQCSEVPPVDSSPEGEGEEECFPIPELPSGRELVINILTTWGDGYYVGLTGIEVFTDSGEVATVAEVRESKQTDRHTYIHTYIHDSSVRFPQILKTSTSSQSTTMTRG